MFLCLSDGRTAPVSGDLVATYVGFKPDNAWCYATSTDASGVANVRPWQSCTRIIRVRTRLPASKAHQEEYDVESYDAPLFLRSGPEFRSWCRFYVQSAAPGVPSSSRSASSKRSISWSVPTVIRRPSE